MNFFFRTAVNKLLSHPILDSSRNLAALDAGFAALAQSAYTQIGEPTILVTQASCFETLFPSCLHNCPAFVIWLPVAHSEDIFEMSRTKPMVYARTSPDLRERDMMMGWGSSRYTFATSAYPLLRSMEMQQNGGAIPMIFATARHAAATVLSIDSGFLATLNREAVRCSTNYYPHAEYSSEVLSAAAKRMHDPFEFELDPNGRSVILLRTPRAELPEKIL